MSVRTGPPLFPALLASLALMALPWQSFGGTVVHDPFTDNSATNTTGGDPLGLVWYRNSTSAATLAVGDDASVAPASKALILTATSTFRGMLAFFPVQTLTAGQVLTLRFDFRFTSAPADNSQSFRFGLYHSNATRQTGDATGTATRFDDFGYGVYTNAAADSPSGTRLFLEKAGDDILGGSSPGGLSGQGTASQSFACGTTARHSAVMRIKRQADDSLLLTAQLDTGTIASATITAAADKFFSFDMIALHNGGASATESFLIDNATLVVNAPPTVALTAPAADAAYAAGATVSLAATATDDGTVSKVEFYRGTTKIGEDTIAPFTFDWTNVGPGVHTFTAVAIDDNGDSGVSAPVDVRVTGGVPDEYDTLRGRWLAQITGGSSYNLSDPEISARVSSVASAGQTQWTNMLKTGGNSRAHLWSDAASSTISAHVSTCYQRLRTMALAYAQAGSSLQGNASLLTDIVGGLDWMNANRYSEAVTPYDNWYDWEIGSPQSLNDIVVLLYDQLSASCFMNQMRAVERFDPTAETFTFNNTYNTGANRTDKACVVAVRGALVKESNKLVSARNSLSPVFTYVTSGDGYYTDGSFIQHGAHPYTGGYGADLIDSLGPTLAMLNSSTWAVTDPNLTNLYRWIYDSYDPFLFRGAFMDCMRGRGVSRSGSEEHARGHDVIKSILQIADFAPTADALAYKRMAKAWISADTARNFITSNTLPAVLRAKAVLADSAITPRPELTGHRRFPGMDRVVHWGTNYVFALSMSSSRIYNYESINSENLHGWYQGDGASYLYNTDIDAYSSAYWPTVNSYRLAGITVDSQTRADAASQSTYSTKSWVGGADILDLYGSAGFELDASASTLTARKSWFMFDDEIVMLGSGITSTDNRSIESIIENRRLKVTTSPITVDSIVKHAASWSETMTNVGWAHVAATGGYVFPGSATLKGMREARTGQWHDINAGGSTTPQTNTFATLWFDHGSNPTDATYASIQLPGRTAAQTAAYAASPHVTILENSAAVHAVREGSLGITAAHFWNDGTRGAGLITVDKKSAVLVREASLQLDVSVSDPTQLNAGTVTLDLARQAYSVASADPRITVSQLTPFTRLIVNVSGTAGRTLKASFILPNAQQSWRQQHFGLMTSTGNAADGADPDKDGLANIIEWACGLSPVTSSALAHTTVRNGGMIEFTYSRSVSALNAGTTFTVEWSDTLPGTSWSSSGVTEQPISDNGTLQQVKASAPTGSGGRRFVHLKVTSPP
ncbi:MAG: polysaccharide lyase family 8 super-sandwich domain-containing protein [Verrucomicrobiota bacterium]